MVITEYTNESYRMIKKGLKGIKMRAIIIFIMTSFLLLGTELTMEDMYISEGLLYERETDTIYTGELKVEGEGIDGYLINKYEQGIMVNSINHFDGTTYFEFEFLGDLHHGLFFDNTDHSIMKIGFMEHGISQGKHEYKSMLKTDKLNIVNGAYHGEVVAIRDGQEEVRYYNKGVLVEDQGKVEEILKVDMTNAYTESELDFVEGRYYTKDGELYTGSIINNKANVTVILKVIKDGVQQETYEYSSLSYVEGRRFYILKRILTPIEDGRVEVINIGFDQKALSSFIVDKDGEEIGLQHGYDEDGKIITN